MKKTILLTLITAMMISATSCSIDVDSIPIESLPIEIVQGTKADTPVTDNNSATGNSPVNNYPVVTSAGNVTQPNSTYTDNNGSTTYVQTSVDNNTSHGTATTVSAESTAPLTTGVPANDVTINLQEKAQELYETAGDVYFHMIYTRDGFGFAPYTTDGSNEELCQEVIGTYIKSVSENITTVEDVKKEMRKVFADPVASQYDAMINKYFREENGKLYTFINGKGGDVSLIGVDLIPVYSDENSAQFNAVAHYDGSQDISRPFSIVCENGIWKVSEFSDPNCEAHETVPESTTENNQENNNDNNAELTAMGLDIYKKAHNMFFHLLINGTYFETNGNYIINEKGLQLDEISDSRVSSINDIKAEMNTVFSESFSSGYYENIDRIYSEYDGKIYQTNQGKGGVLDLDYISLNLTYADENTLQFNVFLTDPNDSSNISDAGQFTLIYENGWKVNNFQFHV